MNGKDISQAKNPHLRASFDALRRAAAMARQITIQTGTELVIREMARSFAFPPMNCARKLSSGESSRLLLVIPARRESKSLPLRGYSN
jgi:hypothetical protein